MAIYLDNAATSWPKPPQVVNAMTDYLNNCGASPGRSAHSFAIKAAREVFETRELIAGFFKVPESERVIFTSNGTHALNLAIKGLLRQGDHVIISHLEHNSVYRPMKHLESAGIIELTIISCNEAGEIDLTNLKKSIKTNTRLVVTLHGSNVSGAVLPVREIGAICKAHSILYLVDAAQTAGLIPIDMQQDNIDLLAFSGHKKLYGPPGIGCLCLKNDLPLSALMQGGTGSLSEMAAHPDFYPDRLEAGTINTVGILGLKAGLKYIVDEGIEKIRREQSQLTEYLIDGLKEIKQLRLISPSKTTHELPDISFTIHGKSPSEIAMQLDREFEIMTRAGLHCSPLAHKTYGTFPQGAVRLSLGLFNTQKEIDLTIASISKLSKT
jgi:cysteine desulfurase / selenocysteine lyase